MERTYKIPLTKRGFLIIIPLMTYCQMPMKKQIILIVIGTLISGYFPVAASDQFLDTCLGIASARDKKLAVAGEQINLAKVRCVRSARAFFPMVSAERTFTTGNT